MLGLDPKFWALVGACTLLPLFPAQASDDTVTDQPAADQPAADQVVKDQIVVTAHRLASPASAVGSSVTVLDAASWESHGFTQVAEALRLVPGLEVSRSGGIGQVTSVFTRGGSSSQTLVLLDGIRLNSATTGAFDFGDLALDDLERIEIVRGPQSTLYGSEAMAGVIQLFTRRQTEGFAVQALGEIGEGDFHRAHLGVQFGDDRFEGRLAAGDQANEAVSAADQRRGNLEKDRFSASQLSGAFDWRLGAAEATPHLHVMAHRSESDSELDGFSFPAGPVDDLDARLERRATLARASLEGGWGPAWRQRVEIAVADDDLFGSDPTDPFGTYRIDSRNLSVGAQADWSHGSQVWTLGAAREKRRGGSVGSFEEEVTVDALYLQDLWQLGDQATLSLGVRHDDFSSFGGESTGRLAFAWQWFPALRLRGSWGTGFKAPTLNDLYFPFFGNVALLPERSRAADLGLDASFLAGRLTGELTYFSQRYEDLIAFDFVTFLPQNIASARSRGLEALVRWRGGDGRWVASLAHTWNETEDRATGFALARRPENRTVLDLSWRPLASWRVSAAAWAVANRIDSDLSPLEDYERLDLAVAWLGSTRLEPSLRVLNVFDDDRAEVGGFSAQPRTVIAGLGVKF